MKEISILLPGQGLHTANFNKPENCKILWPLDYSSYGDIRVAVPDGCKAYQPSNPECGCFHCTFNKYFNQANSNTNHEEEQPEE